MMLARLAGLAATAVACFVLLDPGSSLIAGTVSHASSRRLMVVGLLATLAPLFWSAGPGGALRVLGWALGVGTIAATLLAAFQIPGVEAGAAACLQLSLLMIAAHAIAEVAEALGARMLGRRCALPGTAIALVLVLVAALPLWLGPAAELSLADRPGFVEVVVAVSPLTHLALASGNDLFHQPWLYQYANLATFRFDYPPVGSVLGAYAVVAGLLLATVAALARWPRAKLSGP